MSNVSIEFDLDMVTAALNSTQHSLRAVGDRIRYAKDRGLTVRPTDRAEYEALVALDDELSSARNELILDG